MRWRSGEKKIKKCVVVKVPVREKVKTENEESGSELVRRKATEDEGRMISYKLA